MSVTAAGEIMGRFYDDFTAGNVDGALAACAEDLEILDPGMGDVHGRERFREYLETFKRAMPDARAIIEQTVESSETVAVEGRFTGTHTGSSPRKTAMWSRPVRLSTFDSLMSHGFATARSSLTTRITTSSGCSRSLA